MLYDVYELGENWQNPDPLAVLRNGPCVADMRLSRRFQNGDSSLQACFYQPGTRDEVLRRLVNAKVQAIGKDSLMLVGTVVVAHRQSAKSKADSFMVGYLCKPPGTPVTVRPQQLVASKAKRELRNPSGFDERDDNIDGLYPTGEMPTSYGPLDPSITM